MNLSEEIPENRLREIPSETSLAERLFLFKFFSQIWDGQSSVVEIGPFFGGTTRAIAMGMREKLSRDPKTKLHTFDLFESYYSADSLMLMLKPMVDAAILSLKSVEKFLKIQTLNFGAFSKRFIKPSLTLRQ